SCCTTTWRGSFTAPAISATKRGSRSALPGRRSVLQIGGQPLLYLLIEVAAVLRFGDPVPGIRPHQEAARHLHALQCAPVFQGIVDGHAEIALSDAEQHRRFP